MLTVILLVEVGILIGIWAGVLAIHEGLDTLLRKLEQFSKQRPTQDTLLDRIALARAKARQAHDEMS